MMYKYSACIVITVCSLVVVESSGAYTTVQVPSGPNSTLEMYLCNGSLESNGTLLQLEAGEHVISSGKFCSVRSLKDIAITGEGSDVTVVRCNSGRGFKFSFIRNLTLSKMAFVGCGLVTTVLPIFITSPVVLYLEFSSVSMQNIAIIDFFGFGVYGYALNQAVMEDTQFSNCSGNCSGAVFQGIFGPATLTVQGCLFTNLSDQYSPFVASALNVWYFNLVTVRDCMFYNLSSLIGAAYVFYSEINIVSNTFVSIRGSALSVSYSFVYIINSTFSRNFAEYGGAVKAVHNYYLSISGSQFNNNVATSYGGAISFLSSVRLLFSNTSMIITNCVFTNNTAATVGGALFIFNSFPLSRVVIEKTMLQNNSAPSGAAIYAGDLHRDVVSQTYVLTLSDLVVQENNCFSCAAEQDVMGAAVYYSEVSAVFINGSLFIGNSPQGAIQGLSGGLHIFGYVLFRNNTGESGGAIGLLNNAHLYFRSECNVTFSGNLASLYGGAIYIQGDPNIPKSILTLCAINVIGKNYSITFNGNKALVSGQSIYATPIYNCTLLLPPDLNNRDFYVKEPSAYYDRVFNISSNTSDVQILSFPVHIQLCSCNTGTQCEFIANRVYKVTTTPGKTVQFTATSVDSNNHTSPTVVYTNVPSNSRSVSLGSQQNVQWIGKSCDKIKYQIYGQENTLISLQLSTFMGDVPTILQITLQQCDPGFVLMTNSEGLLTCNCSSFLMSSSVSCDVDSSTVIRSNNQWIGVYNNGIKDLPAVVYTCPLDYCRSNFYQLSLLLPDDLCDKNRHGLLCGHCYSNLSVVFGSTQCQVCSDLWLLTIFLYGALGIVLVAVLFMLNLTVGQGSIYGLIFYANVVQVNSSILFSQPSLKPLQILISFINLDLGFPLCFFNGMDDVAKTGLQFVFPAYLLALTLTVVMVCHYCLCQSTVPNVSNLYLNRFSHFVGKRAVGVLATLIYLSYSKLLRTVIEILTYATVKVEDNTQFRVWFYDGTIRYLEGRHLPLFVIAIVTSVFFIFPYSLALTFIPIIGRHSDHNRLFTWLHQKANLLKPMNDACYAPYKDVWRSWLGVRLWLLVILYITTPFYSSDRPYLLMYIHAIILVVFMFIQAHVKPFEEALKVKDNVLADIYNWTDSFYILNYTVLAVTVSYLLTTGSNTHHIAIAVGSLVGLSGIIIFGTFVHHLFMSARSICKTCVTSKGREVRSSTTSMQSETFETIKQSVSLTFTSVSYDVEKENDLREPLMESL